MKKISGNKLFLMNHYTNLKGKHANKFDKIKTRKINTTFISYRL